MNYEIILILLNAKFGRISKLAKKFMTMSDLYSAPGSFDANYGIHFHNLDVHSYVILLAPFDVTKILKIIT